MVSSSSRPLNLRMRADVEIKRQSYQGREYWVVKDPIALKYYRFEEEEFALLKMLDGKSSPDQIKRQFDYEFAPQKITMQELFQFVGMLYRSSLLISSMAGQGVELIKRGNTNRNREFKSKLTNVLAVRFRGFDPDPILNWMNGWFGWFFSIPVAIMVFALWISAGALLFSNFESFAGKLPSFHEFFAAKNWIWLSLVLAGTKIIHEFGHGLACKKFGGQCHEMGVMLLVMTPCLYCNVSDSWMLPSKWKRAMIAAAGMYVELVLAAIAVFVWWFTREGLVNQLALNVIFVSSVSTILFNANPLLRYDGYYILSDLTEIPNLRSKATTLLQRTMGKWILGIESKSDPFLPVKRKWFFISFSIAAAVYRWFVTAMIFWFLYRLLEPYGLKIIGQMIAMVAVWGLVGMPLIQLYKFFSVPGRFGTVKRGRAILAATIFCAIVGAILLIPIPHHVYCYFIVQPQNVANVYVDIGGTLKNVDVDQEQQVTAGQRLAEIASRDLELQLQTLAGRVKQAKTKYNAAQAAADYETGFVTDVDASYASWESAYSDFDQRWQDLKLLEIRSPIDGFLIFPPKTEKKESDSGELSEWHGVPLEQRNVGAFLTQSTLIAKVVPDPNKLEAVLAIDQGQIEFVRSDQDVKLLVSQIPGEIFEAKTENISPQKMKSVPKGLSSRFGGDLIATQDADGVDVPQSTTYLVSVPMETEQLTLLNGATGRAKVRVGSQTVGQRIWRAVYRTFRFDL